MAKNSKMHPRHMTQAQLVSSAPKRGFVARPIAGGQRSVYVREGFTLIPCRGDAHSNPHIDNCGQCMGGTWGYRAVRMPSQFELVAVRILDLAEAYMTDVVQGRETGSRSRLILALDSLREHAIELNLPLGNEAE